MTVSIATAQPANDTGYVQMCECGQGPRVGGHSTGCAECERIDQQRYASTRLGVRILAVLRFHDSLGTFDLAEAMNAGQDDIAQAIAPLVASGRVERMGKSNATTYRLRRAV